MQSHAEGELNTIYSWSLDNEWESNHYINTQHLNFSKYSNVAISLFVFNLIAYGNDGKYIIDDGDYILKIGDIGHFNIKIKNGENVDDRKQLLHIGTQQDVSCTLYRSNGEIIDIIHEKGYNAPLYLVTMLAHYDQIP